MSLGPFLAYRALYSCLQAERNFLNKLLSLALLAYSFGQASRCCWGYVSGQIQMKHRASAPSKSAHQFRLQYQPLGFWISSLDRRHETTIVCVSGQIQRWRFRDPKAYPFPLWFQFSSNSLSSSLWTGSAWISFSASGQIHWDGLWVYWLPPCVSIFSTSLRQTYLRAAFHRQKNTFCSSRWTGIVLIPILASGQIHQEKLWVYH